MDSSQLNELEQLVKAANLPWRIYKEYQLDDQHEEIRDANNYYVKNLNGKRDKYLLTACNTAPELVIENRTLREQVQMRQELVEQYEQDIAKLRQKVRELERQREFFIEALDKEHLCPRNCWPDGSSIDMQNCIEMNTKACWIRAYEHAAKETGKCVDVFSL